MAVFSYIFSDAARSGVKVHESGKQKSHYLCSSRRVISLNGGPLPLQMNEQTSVMDAIYHQGLLPLLLVNITQFTCRGSSSKRAEIPIIWRGKSIGHSPRLTHCRGVLCDERHLSKKGGHWFASMKLQTAVYMRIVSAENEVEARRKRKCLCWMTEREKRNTKSLNRLVNLKYLTLNISAYNLEASD